jgi:hypothetical protein
MIPGRVANASRYLGAPLGWNPETDGPCGHLAIVDMDTTAGPAMMSVWEPTPEEIARIVAGANVRLIVVGRIHPPVELSVGPPP